jgi:hypothetical protein
MIRQVEVLLPSSEAMMAGGSAKKVLPVDNAKNSRHFRVALDG